MPSARTGLHEEATGQFGYREPRYAPDPGSSYLATDLLCPECGAARGERCAGQRICSARIAAARVAIESGELKPTGPAVPQHVACPNCGKRTKNARPLPCSEAHRCPKVVGGYRCRYAVEPGSDLCGHHQVFTPHGTRPGRKPSLDRAQEADIVRRYRAGGVTQGELADEYGVSKNVISLAIKRATS